MERTKLKQEAYNAATRHIAESIYSGAKLWGLMNRLSDVELNRIACGYVEETIGGSIESTRLPKDYDRRSVTVEAGEYVLGDPCYLLSEGQYNKWLEDADYFSYRHVFSAAVNGHLVVGLSTRGDGSFVSSEGDTYCVDSGLLAIVPKALIPDAEHSITFENTFECGFNDSEIHFGKIRFKTA